MTLWGNAPLRPFEVQLPDESVQNPAIPSKFQVLQGDGGGGREVTPLRYYRRVFTAPLHVGLGAQRKLKLLSTFKAPQMDDGAVI